MQVGTVPHGLRKAWRTLALQDLKRLVSSLDKEPSKYLMRIMELLKAREESMTEIKDLQESWMSELFQQTEEGSRKGGADRSYPQLPKDQKRTIDCRKRIQGG